MARDSHRRRASQVDSNPEALMNAMNLVGAVAAMLALGALPLRAQTTVEGDV